MIMRKMMVDDDMRMDHLESDLTRSVASQQIYVIYAMCIVSFISTASPQELECFVPG